MEFKKELLEEIDRILKIGITRGNLSWFDVNSNELGKTAWRVCKSFNFIYLNDNTSAELTEKGVDVLQDGGIEKYLKNIENEKTLENAIKILTSKKLKYDVWYNIAYILVGGLLGVTTSLVIPDKSKEYIKELNKSTFDKFELNDSFQKHLNDKNILILSLQKELDSLKKVKSD
jgi:hypothetical protein